MQVTGILEGYVKSITYRELRLSEVSIPAFMSPQSGHKETAVPDMRKP